MEIKNIEFSYGKNKVLDDISFKIPDGKVTTIIGANGCGKSTLFNVMTKNLKPQKGSVILDGKDINTISLKAFAKQAAIVHQYNTAPNDITVETLVGYGRLAHRKFAHQNKEEDEKYIERALKAASLEDLRKCNISELSGGQRQRAWIAMALAQNTKLLFLDEPTTYLDIRYQLEILELVKKLNREFGITIVMVLHEINQAIRFSDSIIGLKDGNVLAHGNPEEIITSELLEQLYGVKLGVTEIDGHKYVLTVG